jgi:LacI family transcriptional regulator
LLGVIEVDLSLTKSRPVTLRVIADELGVHVSTVSRVLNSPELDVERWASQEMVERIREVARKLDYHPHPYAASLRTARSSIVGVIVPRLQDFVLATIYEGIEEAAIENRLSTFVTNSLDRPENQRTAASMMLNRRVDGMIFGDAHLDDPFLDELAARDIPFVLANRHAGKHVSVTCNDYLGGRLVAEHLLAIGCRDLAILAGQSFTSTAQDRTRGAVDAFREAGIRVPASRIVFGEFDVAGGRNAAETLLASGSIPDAIFATNDFAAIGASGVLRDHGLRVPMDVALAGYNDTPLAAEMSVPLTTVRSPMHLIGRRALEQLLGVMRGVPVASEQLEPELIVRASTDRKSVA